MSLRAFGLLAILTLVVPATLARAGEVEEVMTAALGLACADGGGAASGMASALPGGASVLGESDLAMGGESFGWRRSFALASGGRLDVTRMAPWGTLRRIDIEYAAPLAPGMVRPALALMADAQCAVREARRIAYDGQGRAEAIERLGPDLAPSGGREPLNPPVPAGEDPGGITVALIDSGVNYLLPKIAASLARDADGRSLGYDYWDMDERPFDANPARSAFFPERHGTRVASVLLREGPRLRLLAYRYPRPDPSRFGALIAHAAAKGARIVNLAMGSNRAEDWRSFADAVRAHPDVLFVVSAGNDGRDIDRRPVWPAALDLDNMIVVTSADGFGAPAPGSNWGKDTVDLLVPGERVPVIDFHGNETIASGASFAAPRLTALAARIAADNPGWRAAELKAALLARAHMTDAADPLTTRYGFLDPGG